MDFITQDEINDGKATDAYFLRTEEALEYADSNPTVVAEVSADQYADGTAEVFAGLDNATELLEGLPITVEALPEGSYFDGGPVMRITGNYLDFARYETPLLGFLSHSSGIATAADTIRRKAQTSVVLSFGGRHVLPQISVTLERCALIAGFDGISHVAAAERLPVEASGTMPHALMLALGENSQEQAFEAYNEGVADEFPRVALCDTYSDEVQEVKKAVKTLGEDLDGVRLDTTSSRRGKFDEIIKEVRWTLRELDREDVDIFVSGGITPDQVEELDPLVDGFGIGSYVSNADPVDFGLDIVELEGEPISKRGKLSGVKNVTDSDGNEILQPLIEDGEVVRDISVEKANQQLQSEREKQ